MSQLGHSFAHATTAELSWHVHKCDLIGSLKSDLQDKKVGFFRDMDHELIIISEMVPQGPVLTAGGPLIQWGSPWPSACGGRPMRAWSAWLVCLGWTCQASGFTTQRASNADPVCVNRRLVTLLHRGHILFVGILPARWLHHTEIFMQILSVAPQSRLLCHT